MTLPGSAQEIMDREFLEIRAKLLQLASHFDRIERRGGDLSEGPRGEQIRRGLEALSSPDFGSHRAEEIQLIFSREFDPGWRANLGVAAAAKQNPAD
jgi:hypothetical protein